jgi:membrane associated rhomboid family serine protease
VHAGVLRLLANVIGFVSVGFMLERLVGPVAFGVTYIAAGVMAGVVELSAHQIDVNTGASGAIFGVYGPARRVHDVGLLSAVSRSHSAGGAEGPRPARSCS